MEAKVEFVRDENFVIGLINSVDKKIKGCFDLLNELDSKISDYKLDDGKMKMESKYISDNEVLNSIMKLEKIRKDYFSELQDLKTKNQ